MWQIILWNSMADRQKRKTMAAWRLFLRFRKEKTIWRQANRSIDRQAFAIPKQKSEESCGAVTALWDSFSYFWNKTGTFCKQTKGRIKADFWERRTEHSKEKISYVTYHKSEKRKDTKRRMGGNLLQAVLDLCYLRCRRISDWIHMVLDWFSWIYEQNQQPVFPNQLHMGIRRSTSAFIYCKRSGKQ